MRRVMVKDNKENLISRFHELVIRLRLLAHQERGVQASPCEKRYHDGYADGLSAAADILVEFKNSKVRKINKNGR
jgi:hypothetical protein